MSVTQEIDPDILTRLRNGLCAITCRIQDVRSGCDCAIAAHEIEQLRMALAASAVARNTHIAMYDALAKALDEIRYPGFNRAGGLDIVAHIEQVRNHAEKSAIAKVTGAA